LRFRSADETVHVSELRVLRAKCTSMHEMINKQGMYGPLAHICQLISRISAEDVNSPTPLILYTQVFPTVTMFEAT
jgi:hypothetical protein